MTVSQSLAAATTQIYSSFPTVTITSNNNLGAGETSLAVLNANGTIASLAITNPGAGYSVPPTIAINGVNVAVATVALGGIGYASAPQAFIGGSQGVVAGSTFGMTVAVEDQFGNVVPTYNTPVSLGAAATVAGPIINNLIGGVLSGSTSVIPVNGVASFSGLTLNKSGDGVSLKKATSGTLVPVQTASFNVVPTAPSQLVVTVQPPPVDIAGTAFNVIVSVEGASGNLATSYNGPVTLSLPADNPGGPASDCRRPRHWAAR